MYFIEHIGLPILNNSLKASGTFLVYGFICIPGFLFIRRKLPETRGKTFEEIEHELTR
jgi:hypothetical protein